jgi:predicted ATPase
VLATSREPLGVVGEVVWPVPPLAEDEAVRLFAERAAKAAPGFPVDHDCLLAVRSLCRRVDRIPLAIELAAAWVCVLTPEQILSELDNRLRLIAGRADGASHSEHTLATSVDWSHDLLEERDRRVFRRLAVFAGGFTLAAARAVCDPDSRSSDDVRAALTRLVDKSLVLADDHNGAIRYRMLDTVCRCAHTQLHAARETAASRDRHLDYFADYAEAELREFESAGLEVEHANLRTALDWGRSTPDRAASGRLAVALPRLWPLHTGAHKDAPPRTWRTSRPA